MLGVHISGVLRVGCTHKGADLRGNAIAQSGLAHQMSRVNVPDAHGVFVVTTSSTHVGSVVAESSSTHCSRKEAFAYLFHKFGGVCVPEVQCWTLAY